MRRRLLFFAFTIVLVATLLPAAGQVPPYPPASAAPAPDAPRPTGPPNGGTLARLGPVTLSFILPEGATQYQVAMIPLQGDGPGLNLIRNAEASLTVPSPMLGAGPYLLLPSMTYTWRVRATSAAGTIDENASTWGPWSDVWSFSTPPPDTDLHALAPLPAGPATGPTPTLTWSTDDGALFYFELQVSRDPAFDTNPTAAMAPVYWNLVHGGESRPLDSWSVPAAVALQPGCRYYWRVRPRVQGGGTPVAWAPSFWFDTAPGPGGPVCGPMPGVLLLDPAGLASVKHRIASGDASMLAPLARLRRDADRALQVAPLTVTDKTVTPPSGDVHDFVSRAPYWWPNPDTPNGLPYVRRDGQVNPESLTFTDDADLTKLISTVHTLALAYYFTGNSSYAGHAALLLRTWFVDPATRMNPNLNFAQGVPGRSGGTPSGIIDAHDLPEVLDAVGLLEGSGALGTADREALRRWFGDYLTWLRTSGNGMAEGRAVNNHGTYYDAAVASIALFLHDTALARAVLEDARTKRIAAQIEPDGRQPQELQRTRAWSYSLFNLEALFRLAALGERAGIDLWHYATPDGRSLRGALDWLVPYATGDASWGYQQIGGFEPQDLYALLLLATRAFPGEGYERAAGRIAPAGSDANRLLLTATP